MRRLWLWLPAALYMGLIFYLSSLANPLPVLTLHVWDKLLHATDTPRWRCCCCAR